MKSITLTDNEGNKITGRLPEGWHQVPLSAFIDWQTRSKGKPDQLRLLYAVACLTELPAGVLEAEVSLAPQLARHMSWLAALPAPEPALAFTHDGVRYEHVGNLEKVSAGQFEALLSCLDQAEHADPIQVAPQLLAVLYKPKGKEQTPDTVSQATEAFRSLPVSKAWGALAFFLTSTAAWARSIQASSEAAKELTRMTLTVEEALATGGASRGRLSRTAAWLVRRYASSVRGILTSSWRT